VFFVGFVEEKHDFRNKNTEMTMYLTAPAQSGTATAQSGTATAQSGTATAQSGTATAQSGTATTQYKVAPKYKFSGQKRHFGRTDYPKNCRNHTRQQEL